MTTAKSGLTALVSGALLAAIAAAPAAAEDVRWPASACKPWAYTKAGGFHETEPEAWMTCKQGKGEELRIALICHKRYMSVRYTRVLKGKSQQPTIVRRKLTYRFAKREYVEYARYEGALTDWVLYRADIDYDHPMFGDFQTAASVTVSLDGLGVTDHVPLSDPKKAVAQVMAACKRKQ